jgi:hypothetical protein
MSLRSALIAAALAAPLSVSAQEPLAASAAACFRQAARQPPAVLEVVVSSYPAVVERGLTITQINFIRPVSLPPQAIAHGLSMIEFGFRSSTKSEMITWGPDGRVCAWIGKVVVNLTPGPVRIYIPKEYAPATCESKVLFLHELEHEKLFRRAVREAANRMRAALRGDPMLSGPLAPIDAAGPEEAYARLKRSVEAVSRPIFTELVKNSRRDQKSLDNPETYRRLGASCSEWKRR